MVELLEKQKNQAIKTEIIAAGAKLAAMDLLPATSGNLSQRGQDHLIITSSGKAKGELEQEDFIEIDFEGQVIDPKSSLKPSAETLLHTQIYKFFPEANAVYHIHSVNTVVISKLIGACKELRLENYELLKALSGISTHKHTEVIPIFRNTQNIKSLAAEVDAYMQNYSELHAYLIEGHGLYSWGKDSAETLRHIEAIETLIEAELKLMQVRGN